MKNKIIAIGLIGFMALTAVLAYKSLDVIEGLEFSDPYDLEEDE